MLHEAIFLAACKATFVALQEKLLRVTPHFAETAIVALRVARKVERPSTLLACNRISSAT